MRKGIVMEKNHRYVVVMTMDGTFHKTRYKNNCEIGQEIEFRDSRVNVFDSLSSLWNVRILTSALVVFLLIFTPVLIWNQSNEAYAFVNLDINPSIELTVNEKLQVTDLTPYNDEARQIMNVLEGWKKDSVEVVTLKIIQQTKASGYLQTDQDVFVGVSYLKGLEQNQDVSEKILAYMNQNQEDNLSILTFEVPKEIHEQAEEEEVSMNYLYAQEVVREEETVQQTGADESEQTQATKKSVHEKLLEKFAADDQPVPPGIEKKLNSDKKTDHEKNLPPGLEKKGDQLPPGLEKKDEQLPPGLEKKNDSTPPGLNKKDDSIPPGLQKKEGELPPGLQKKEGKVPPGLQNKEKKTPPGLEKKQNNSSRGPNRDDGSLPPGLQKFQ